MQIIKEIRVEKVVERADQQFTATGVGVVRTNTYGCDLGLLKRLANEARETFPELADENIRVVHFGGERYARTFGIEFDLPGVTQAPHGWVEIRELEKLR